MQDCQTEKIQSFLCNLQLHDGKADTEPVFMKWMKVMKENYIIVITSQSMTL